MTHNLQSERSSSPLGNRTHSGWPSWSRRSSSQTIEQAEDAGYLRRGGPFEWGGWSRIISRDYSLLTRNVA
jgi:hypothetical protein